MKLAVATVLGCVVLAGSPATATEPVSIRVNPTVSMAPATVILSVTVEPDERNRVLTVVTDSPDFYSASEVELEGERASRLQRFTVRGLPAGDYVVQARITRADSSERVAETQLMVTGGM
jgi:hypothetical protein